MRVADAMEQLVPVMGVSSVLGAPHSIEIGQMLPPVTLDAARDRLAVVEQAQDAATSDYAYWGYQGQISYFKAVIELLEAAELVGPDSLPDIAMPDMSNRVVMDACYAMEDWAKRVREAAEAGRTGPTVSYVVEYEYSPLRQPARTVGFEDRAYADHYATKVGARHRIIKVTEEVITEWTDPK